MSLACTNIRDVEHDWFANRTELRETSYDATSGEMVVEGNELDSVVNGEGYGIGYLGCQCWPKCAVALTFRHDNAVPFGGRSAGRARRL
jgi:hypothetical protein